MSEETKHAPLPWAVDSDPARIDCERFIEDANGNDVAACDVANVTAKDEDNAAFIVRACNAHEELLRQLETVLACLEIVGAYYGDIPRLRAAIAKGRGQSTLSEAPA